MVPPETGKDKTFPLIHWDSWLYPNMVGLDHIEYKGEKYPVRAICLKFEPKGELHTVNVATTRLQKLLEPFEEPLEESIDSEIYFYVSDEEIMMDRADLAALVAGETDAFVPNESEWKAWEEENIL